MSDIDWAVVQAAANRAIRDHARAYAIPANFLAGGVPELMDRMAQNWADVMAPHVTACIREDLRKSELRGGVSGGQP